MAYGQVQVLAILMTKEVWKTIKNFPDYEVSNHGNVRSKRKKGKEIHMKLGYHYKGYRIVFLYREKNKDYKCFVHRLVAEMFIENVNNHPIVNHKDLNKENNHIMNLEWVDDSGNQVHWREMRKNSDEPEF